MEIMVEISDELAEARALVNSAEGKERANIMKKTVCADQLPQVDQCKECFLWSKCKGLATWDLIESWTKQYNVDLTIFPREYQALNQ